MDHTKRLFMGSVATAIGASWLSACASSQGESQPALEDWPTDWREETCRQVEALLGAETPDHREAMFAELLLGIEAAGYVEFLSALRRGYVELGRPKLTWVGYTTTRLTGPEWLGYPDPDSIKAIEPVMAQVFISIPLHGTEADEHRRDVLCAWTVVSSNETRLAGVFPLVMGR